VGGSLAVAAKLRAQTHQTAKVAATVRSAGLVAVPEDPFGPAAVLPFDIFGRGTYRGVGPVVHDPRAPERHLRVFDFWWETVDAEGNRRRSWRTCGVATTGLDAPYLVITPESLTTRLVGAAVGTDIEVESDEFNRLYYLRCRDRRFATAFCTPGVIDLCVAAGGELSIEAHQGYVLVHTDRLRPDRYAGLYRYLEQLLGAIPRDLHELFDPGPRRCGG
jgi:hypothetical protein